MENITDLILANENLIYKIISKYKNYFELEDLYQVAVMGMIKAYNNYKDCYNTKFTTYAYPYILGEVIKYINEFRTVKTNKNIQILYHQILKTKEILTQKLMKEPSTYEIALFLEIDENVIIDVINANGTALSLDKIISEDGKNLELYDKYGYVDNNLENYPLFREIEKLSEEERQIIISRYYEDMSQSEVGSIMGMYQVEVSRKEKKILQKLKNNIAA